MKKILVCLCLLLSMACARKIAANGEPSSRYHTTLRHHTKEHKSYTMEKVLYKTSIAYKSCDLRKAYVEEYADVYKSNSSDIEKMMAEEMADCEKYDAFVVAHFASDKETRRIETKSGVWKVTLLSAGSSDAVAPESVMALPGERPVSEYFYPFISPWSRTYLVKFPKQPGNALTLNMDGIEGNLQFSWK